MIMQMAILVAGVPGMGDIKGVLGITGTKGKLLSVGLRGHRVKAAWLALSLRSLTALGEGQEPECPSGEARGRGGLGPMK